MQLYSFYSSPTHTLLGASSFFGRLYNKFGQSDQHLSFPHAGHPWYPHCSGVGSQSLEDKQASSLGIELNKSE